MFPFRREFGKRGQGRDGEKGSAVYPGHIWLPQVGELRQRAGTGDTGQPRAWSGAPG